jgi:hypothetical protein
MNIKNTNHFLREKKIKNIIVHGLLTSVHTHRYIHEAIYSTFKYIVETLTLKINVEWIDDDKSVCDFYKNIEGKCLIFTSPHYNTDKFLPILNNTYYILHYRTHNKITNTLVTKYNHLLKKKKAVKYVEYRGGPNTHFNKMFAQYIDDKRLFWSYYYVPRKDEDYDLDIEEKVNYTYLHQPTNEVHMAWGTNLLPEEINENIKLVKNKIKLNKSSYFCGTIWYTNEKEVAEWKFACISKKINTRFDKERDEIQHQIKIREAFVAPAFQGASQKECKDWYYIPCRILKNISYGALGVTNNIGVYNIFKDYLILYDENLDNLLQKTLEYRKYAQENPEEYIEKMVEMMEFIRDNHTYLNRIDALIKYGFN